MRENTRLRQPSSVDAVVHRDGDHNGESRANRLESIPRIVRFGRSIRIIRRIRRVGISRFRGSWSRGGCAVPRVSTSRFLTRTETNCESNTSAPSFRVESTTAEPVRAERERQSIWNRFGSTSRDDWRIRIGRVLQSKWWGWSVVRGVAPHPFVSSGAAKQRGGGASIGLLGGKELSYNSKNNIRKPVEIRYRWDEVV